MGGQVIVTMSESDRSGDDAPTPDAELGSSTLVTTDDEAVLYDPSNPSRWLTSDSPVDLATCR